MKANNEEQSKLAEYEAAIKRNLYVFYETGGALQKIRDERLYRVTHVTFEKYCQERWDLTRRHANRLIESAQIVETLSKLGPLVPILATESQARELVGLTPEEQGKVWIEAAKTALDGQITAAHIRETREALLGSRRDPVQPELFTLEEYREAIKDHVDAANHHGREEKYHRREAKRLCDEAFKKFAVQIELPFEFDDQTT